MKPHDLSDFGKPGKVLMREQHGRVPADNAEPLPDKKMEDFFLELDSEMRASSKSGLGQKRKADTRPGPSAPKDESKKPPHRPSAEDIEKQHQDFFEKQQKRLMLRR